MSYDYDTERREAIDAGIRALDSLHTALDDLDRARGWGVVDILGGGLISTLIKRSRMNSAKEHMQQASYDLQRFSSELTDVGLNLNLKADDFLAFADWFFDGLVADVLIQDRINTARSNVSSAINQVERILQRLES